MKNNKLRKSTCILLGIASALFVLAILIEVWVAVDLTLNPVTGSGWIMLEIGLGVVMVSILGFIFACIAAGFIHKDRKKGKIPGGIRFIEVITLLQIPIVILGLYIAGTILANTAYNYPVRIQNTLDSLYPDYRIMGKCDDFGYGFVPGTAVKIQTSTSRQPILIHFRWDGAKPGAENFEIVDDLEDYHYCNPR